MNQDNRENDLFPIATPRWIAARKRRRAVASAEMMRKVAGLTPSQCYVEGEADGWTADYFQSRTTQEGLFQ